MGVHGKHEDYGSYQYLKAPRDFREFELVEGEGPFASYLLPLSNENEKEKRVQDLAERTIIGMAIDCSHSSPRTTLDTRRAASPSFSPIREPGPSGTSSASLRTRSESL